MTTLEQRLNANLLAEGADTAHRNLGQCSVCRRSILYAERYAAIVPDGTLAHITCIVVRRRAVPVIR